MTEDKLVELQLKYALEHFSFRAQQRTTMFHFFLISSGVLTNAIVLLVEQKLFYPACGVSLVGAFLSWCFNRLDKRNAYLLGYGKHVLKYLEETKLFKKEKYEDVTLGFLLREGVEKDSAEEKAQRKIRHSAWIPRVQIVVLLAFMTAAGLTFSAQAGWLGT